MTGGKIRGGVRMVLCARGNDGSSVLATIGPKPKVENYDFEILDEGDFGGRGHADV